MRKTPSKSDISHVSADDFGSFRDFPLADSDQCVKCGLCLPHCPTYKLSRHEGDSPRGRIALMQGLAQDLLPAEGSALPHLDGCLVCRACEPVCPAQVPYGRLIDAGRKGLWRSGHRPGWLWRSLAFMRRTPLRLRVLAQLLRVMHRARLASLVAKLPLGRISRATEFVERTARPPATGTYAPVGSSCGHVILFLGCIARSLDAPVLHAAIRVLNAMKMTVDVPALQACCGAMDAHAGDAESTAHLARTNIEAFGSDGEVVLSTSSGCGIQLRDYSELEIEGATEFSARVHDIMHFIAMHAERLPALGHEPMRVIVHAPCTLKNGLRERGAIDVLQRIDGVTVEPLHHQDCCGAAGTYLFEHAETADKLGARLLDALGDDVPDVFVTSNIGCALHIRRLARKRGLRLQVCHPVELLAASLRDSASIGTGI